MSEKEILEKAIQKAIDGGLPMSCEKLKSFKYYEIETDGYTEDSSIYGYIKQVSSGEPRYEWEWFSNEQLIFNHDFAKALWGDEEKDCHCVVCGTTWSHLLDCPYRSSGRNLWLDAYKYHLQQMVIADDPIKYLGDNL
jgi:hypothetical protein